jgi:glutamate racemase
VISDFVDQNAGLFGSLTLIQGGFLSRCNAGSIFIFGPQLLIWRETSPASDAGKAENGEEFQFPVTRPLFTLWAVNSAPLGFFDSGVGGLTVVRAVQELLPAEDILYLGDTARLPYGSKSPETIRHFADEDVRFLISKGVKAVVVACNTATAHALPQLREHYRIPILGVIEPGVEAALSCPNAERIGIIATRGTIGSHAYQHALALRKTGLIIHSQATPLLVPLIEENWIEHPATRLVLKAYLDPLVEKGMDTLLLACTHYPLLIPVLKELLPAHIRLVDSATTCAEHLKNELTRLDLLQSEERDGSLELHLTDLSEAFESLARQFLKKSPGRIRRAILGGL